MGIKKPKKFDFTETRELACPFYTDWTFTIRRSDDPAYQAHLKGRREEYGEAWKIAQAAMKHKTIAEIAVPRSIETGKRDEQILKHVFDALSKEFGPVELDLDSWAKLGNDVPGALILIDSIKGVLGDDGKPRRADDPGMHGELLELPWPVPEKHEDNDLPDDALLVPAFTPLGEAITRWVAHEAKKTALYRREEIEATEKN